MTGSQQQLAYSPREAPFARRGGSAPALGNEERGLGLIALHLHAPLLAQRRLLASLPSLEHDKVFCMPGTDGEHAAFACCTEVLFGTDHRGRAAVSADDSFLIAALQP